MPVLGLQSYEAKVVEVSGGYIALLSYDNRFRGSLPHSKVARLDSAGNTIWIRDIESPPKNGTNMVKILPLDDGRFIVIGSNYDCSMANYMLRILQFSDSGEMLWDRSHYIDSNTPWYPSRQAYLDHSNGTVVIPTYELFQNLIVRIDNGDLVKTVPNRHVSAVPIPGQQGISVTNEIETKQIKLVQADSVVKVFRDTGNHSTTLGIKTYTVAPQIAINFEYHINLYDLDGNFSSTLLNYYAYNFGAFDIKDGKYLAAYCAYPVKRIIFFEKTGALFDEVAVLYLPALKNQQVSDIRWNGNNIILEGYSNAVMQPDGYTGSWLFQSFYFYYTLDVATGKLTIPKSDVALTNVEFDRQSWWYDQDTLMPAYFKPHQITFTLKNMGTDTLKSAMICLGRFRLPGEPCYRDSSYFRMIDHLYVLPGDTAVITLDDIPLSITDPLNLSDSVCFWVALPNNHLEDKLDDNAYCLQPGSIQLPSPGQMHVFPNPVNDKLFVLPEKVGFLKARVQILALTGQILFDGYVGATADYFIVNTAFLRPGLYVVRVGDAVFKIQKV